MSYTRYELPPTPTPADLKQVADDYRAIICGVIRSIVERYQRTPDYPFIDTKLNLITGEDFDDEDPIRGRGAV